MTSSNNSNPAAEGRPCQHIAASGFRLRALEPEDLDLLYQIENDQELWKYGSTTVPYSRYVLRQYIAEAKNDLFADGQVRLVAESDKAAVGLCDLTNFDAQHLRAEVGLLILPDRQRQGFGLLALRALADYARQLMLHQLYAIVADDNVPAQHLFGRCGFHPSAHLSDWVRRPKGFCHATLWQLILSRLRKNP